MAPKHLETTLSVRVPLRLLAAGATGGPGPAPILIGMHGYGQDAESLLPILLHVAPPGSLVLSLEGPESAYLEGANTSVPKRGFHWGVSTREDEIYSLGKIAHYRERLAARFRSATHSLYDGSHRVPSASADEVRIFLSAHG